tara:strand:- start:769 stop:1104 length:336 start_codon:yes stop_codon:yes gene_type:complete
MAITKFKSLTKANDAISRQTKELSRKRSEIKSMPMSTAITSFAAVQGGAIAVGAAKSQFGDTIALGMPTESAGALVAVVAGYFMKSPMLINVGAGMLAPYIAERTQEMLET